MGSGYQDRRGWDAPHPSIGAGVGRDHETTSFHRFAAEMPNVQAPRWKEEVWGGKGEPGALWIMR